MLILCWNRKIDYIREVSENSRKKRKSGGAKGPLGGIQWIPNAVGKMPERRSKSSLGRHEKE